MKINSYKNTQLANGLARVVITMVLVIAILFAGIIGMAVLKKFGPEADKEAPPKIIPTVKVVTAVMADKQLYVRTQGEIKARTSTQLASEVMGKVVTVSPKLKTGGTFQANEVMLEIDKSDYVSALAKAESALADAKLALEQEEARAQQAMRDWRKLGKGEAPDLVARKPQLASIRARVAAAEAEVGRATRDLERTVIRAPYLCRIDQSYTDLGSYITPGARVADVYSIRVRELRVPVPLDDLAYLKKQSPIGSKVHVEAELAGETKQWSGSVIRNEGKVDRNTMMIHLVVEIAPSKSQPMHELPPPGLFVSASIKGRVMHKAVQIPRRALRADDSVLAVDQDGRLQILPVEVARTMERAVLISSGIPEGAKIIVSAIETPVPGMKINIEATPEDSE